MKGAIFHHKIPHLQNVREEESSKHLEKVLLLVPIEDVSKIFGILNIFW